MEIKNSLINKKAAAAVSTIKRDFSAWLLLAPFVFFLFMMLLIPTFRAFVWSFFEMKGYNVGEFIGLDNYRVVFQNTEFLKTLFNTVKYVFWSLLIGFWPPILVAILLNELRFGKSFFRLSIYFPIIVPSIAVSMLWYYLLYPNETGLINMLIGAFGGESLQWLQNSDYTIILIIVSIAWRSLGSNMLIYLASLQSISPDLYEAAVMDGASLWRRTVKITIPHMSGLILLNFVRHIINIFQIMEQPLAMTGGGPNGASMSLGLLGYKYAFQSFKVGNSLAVNVIMFLMLVLLSIFYYAVKGKLERDE